MQHLNRPTPANPVQDVQTYALRAPRSTHTRSATCVEVDCEQYRTGWTTTMITGSVDDVFLRKTAAGRVDGIPRRYLEAVDLPEKGFTRYTFAPETPCFRASQHRVDLERPVLYVVEHGDWRQRLGTLRTHTPDGWVNDFGEHQARIDRAVNGSPQ